MNDNAMPEKSDFRRKYINMEGGIHASTGSLSDKHPCFGCVWYNRNTDVLFCPFHSCVRYKKGFMPRKR